MKKILSFIIILSVLLLSSCEGGAGESTTTYDVLGLGSCVLYPPTTSPIKTLDDGTTVHSGFEDVDLGGRVIRIESEFDSDDWQIYEISGRDETKPEALSAAIAERNETIERLYNCTIEYVRRIDSVISEAEPAAIALFSFDAYSKTGNGYYNLATIGIDFSNPWWDRSYIDEMTVDGYLYSITGAFSLSVYDATRALYFNRDILNDAPALAETDVYSLVESGEWTADEFIRLIKLSASDAYYGITGADSAIASFYFGVGGDYLIKSDDAAGNTSFSSYGAIYEATFDTVAKIFSSEQAKILDGVSASELFKEGKTLFVSGSVAQMQDFAGMNFGVLPYPLYNREQMAAVGFQSIVDSGFYYITVPKSLNYDPAIISAFLEVYAFHSQYIVFPEYESLLKYTYLKDDKDRNMLDIIFAGRTYDIARYHGFCDAEQYVVDGIKSGSDISANWKEDKVSALEAAGKAYKNYLRENAR